MADRDQYLLRALVTAQRERKMALKTRDAGLIKSAETRLAVAWKNSHGVLGTFNDQEKK